MGVVECMCVRVCACMYVCVCMRARVMLTCIKILKIIMQKMNYNFYILLIFCEPQIFPAQVVTLTTEGGYICKSIQNECI